MIGAIHPLQDFGVKILTAIIILLLTAINYRGVALGGKVQLVFTTLKVAALGFIVLCAFAIGNGSFANFPQTVLIQMVVLQFHRDGTY